nr:glyoxalase superfamily protein [Paraburkholderia sp. BL10I2N1]
MRRLSRLFSGLGAPYSDSFPLCVQIRRSGLTLHFGEHHGDASPGTTIFVPVKNIDALHAERRERYYRRGKPGVEVLKWGKVMELFAPFGNRIRL